MGLEVIEDLSHKILNPFLLGNGVRLIASDDGKQSASRVIGEMCMPNIKTDRVEYILPVLLVGL